jgi:hypothetical protein
MYTFDNSLYSPLAIDVKTSYEVQDSVSSANIKLLSFSCKNNKTSGTFFQDFEKDIDIYLVQEH